MTERLLRSLDDNGLLGRTIRVLGTNALYAYEAVAGVRVDQGLTTTEDVDLLFDARARVSLIWDAGEDSNSLLRLLQRVDKSFERSPQGFRAVNRTGYLVDLIKPIPEPPWKSEPDRIGDDADDLVAVGIEGLDWLCNAPAFEAVAIDERGEPLPIVTSDPRVFAAHKLWLSKRSDREPIKRRRDLEQARAVARLAADYLQHLPFRAEELQMLPRDVVAAAAPMFEDAGRKQA